MTKPGSLDHHARRYAQGFHSRECREAAFDGEIFWEMVGEMVDTLIERFPHVDASILMDSARDELHDEIISRGIRFN